MEFGLEKFASVAINQGKITSGNGIKMQSAIRSCQNEAYEYLGKI